MFIHYDVVHRAALELSDSAEIKQDEFEQHYHCQFGMGTMYHYWLEFKTDEDATAFLLRWA